MQNNPALLIWDNFEPVAGFPAGNEPLLSKSERDNLQQFLKSLRGGQSWVLITSRREEGWLDCGYALQTLQGLSHQDAAEFAAKVLQSAEVDRAKLPKEYLELLKLLGGHPLSDTVGEILLNINTADLPCITWRGCSTFPCNTPKEKLS